MRILTTWLIAIVAGVMLHLTIPSWMPPGSQHIRSRRWLDVTPPPEAPPKDFEEVDFEEATLKIAWLMSFPNSGTSYTLRLITRTSQTLVATNYQKTEATSERKLYPVYTNQSEGPFWPDPKESQYSRPTTYVLTKTHCGSRCNDCSPSKYLQHPLSFTRLCQSGSKWEETIGGVPQIARVEYDSNLVHKAIHLIRNPFDNVVSRFHLERHRMARRGDNESLTLYSDSRDGFRRYCQHVDEKWKPEAQATYLIKEGKSMENVTCRDDFFRYVLWHNLAFYATDSALRVPTYILHYEDYSKSFNDTVSELLDFLNLTQVNEPYPFKQGHAYHDYFTQDERDEVKNAMKMLSFPKTWRNIQRYFD